MGLSFLYGGENLWYNRYGIPYFSYREEARTMEAAVMHDTFIDNAKVMAKGQVTIPKDVRNVLGITNGSRVTFVVEQGTVRLVNSATYAMQMLQREMAEEGAELSEADVMALVKDVRRTQV